MPKKTKKEKPTHTEKVEKTIYAENKKRSVYLASEKAEILIESNNEEDSLGDILSSAMALIIESKDLKEERKYVT